METLKERIISKKTLYSVCFFAFMVIDWTRGSQVGSTWAWTVNITGIVMATIMFSAYDLKVFLQPVYMIYSIICIIALPASYIWWNANQAIIYRDKLLTAVWNVWLLGILLIKMYRDVWIDKTRKLHFSKMEILAAVMLLWMFFSLNEDIWPLWYLIIFGLFYRTEYTERDMGDLKEGLLNGVISGFFVLQGAALMFRPFDDGQHRYCGIYSNCNINALFYCVVLIAFLVKLYDAEKKDEKKWKKAVYFLFIGIILVLICFTISKTAMVSAFAVLFFYMIFAQFVLLRQKAKKAIAYIFLTFFLFCVSFPVVYGAVRYIPSIFHHPIWYEGEYSEDKVHSFDPWNSEKYVSFEELTEGITVRISPFVRSIFRKIGIDMNSVDAAEPISDIVESVEVQEESILDNYAIHGRLGIWNYYLRNGTLLGHSSNEGHDIGWENWYVWHAQNVFVQFWFYYGIPSAILLLLMVVGLTYSSIKDICKNQENALICMLYVILFGMYGMFECVWYPGQMILLLFFLTPVFLRKER